jgi:Protein of unknown function (DUF2924)
MRDNGFASKRQDRETGTAIARELAALPLKTVSELANQHLALFNEPTRSRNKRYLIKRIGWGLQEKASGGLSARALERIDKLAPLAPVRWQASFKTATFQEQRPKRDRRLPPSGETLRRIYSGVEYQVKVLDDRFEFDGKLFRSLSGVAKKITGIQWNGYRFFFGDKDATVRNGGAS